MLQHILQLPGHAALFDLQTGVLIRAHQFYHLYFIPPEIQIGRFPGMLTGVCLEVCKENPQILPGNLLQR